MHLLDRSADGLTWLGRHGTRAVAISMFVGIAVPPLGALLRPYFPETVVLLLILSFLRVDPDALRAQWARPRLLVMAATWTMLILPLIALLALFGIGLAAFPDLRGAPGLLLALVLHAVAP